MLLTVYQVLWPRDVLPEVAVSWPNKPAKPFDLMNQIYKFEVLAFFISGEAMIV